jgi:hypothetical protein
MASVSTPDNDEDIRNKIALEELAKALSRRIVFGFLGSGCSKKLGYPLWSELIEELENCVRRKDSTINLEIYKSLDQHEKDNLWYAGFLKGRLSDAEFKDLIRDTFSPRPAGIGNFHRQLISIPFKHFLTLNYDTLLEITANHLSMGINSFHWNQQEEVARFFQQINEPEASGVPRSIFHVHGLFNDHRSVILTENDYLKLYFTDNLTVKVLWSIIASFRMLFVGFGVKDLDLLYFFRKARWDLGREEHRHFAIMNENVPTTRIYKRQYLREKYGIEPIFYSTIDAPNPYKEEEDLIAKLVRVGSSSLAPEDTLKEDVKRLDENTAI